MLELQILDRPSDLLFWTAPSPDSEIAPEDPLALDYVAQQVGLFLLPTLTTRSSRAQAYAMVLYGLELARKACPVEDEETQRELFERWERFWALAVLEYRKGRLPRGDGDTMRGVRGALRNWFRGEKALPLDFQLISRQQELGSLGAYLVPLRAAGLVMSGTLRPSPAASDILAAFWDEPSESSHASRYESYALQALDATQSKIDRKHGNLTLARVGERSRLSSLVARKRREQQERLYRALVEEVHDRTKTTWPMSLLVEHAVRDGVGHARELLLDAIGGRWGTQGASLVDVMRTAVLYGDWMDAVLRVFDRVYAAVADAGWQAPRPKVASDVLADRRALSDACARFLDAPELARIQRLPVHGAAAVRLAADLRTGTADDALARLLEYHHGVQRERRRGEAWIRDRAGHLTLSVTNYNARPELSRFPGYKLDVLRQLLVDVGRLSPGTIVEEAS
ncbi:MAG: hypothetical protein K8H88_17195 [Sandaracinaceae bacterium]|nr:hypothetical protein [Sandaracinaceae bacterium]